MVSAETVQSIVASVPILDIHTHLYQPSFDMTLSGIDELLTYHYLVCEVMRFAPITPAQFYASSKMDQADIIWEHLFVRNNPISEATAGVIRVMRALDLDPNATNLRQARDYFRSIKPTQHLTNVLNLAGVKSYVMTNDPLDPIEAPHWQRGADLDPRFLAALRIDPILNDWENASAKLNGKGYQTYAALDDVSLTEIRRFLTDWIKIMRPKYMAVSLPPSFAFPEQSPRIEVLTKAVLPVCEDNGLPFAMMIGVNKRVHPELIEAGDSVGYSDMTVVERLCHAFPKNRFLVTVLARENQHGLCVAARKFSNLLPFGCWWFMNNPSLVRETTRMRLEMLGTTFVPQHSDARVLEQLIYKWQHSRKDIATALSERYQALQRTGCNEQLERVARLLLHDNAAEWIGA